MAENNEAEIMKLIQKAHELRAQYTPGTPVDDIGLGVRVGYDAAQGWTAVKDGLPAVEGEYLVTAVPYNPYAPDAHFPRKVMKRFFRRNEWCVQNGSVSQSEVIAWMPLPKPCEAGVKP